MNTNEPRNRREEFAAIFVQAIIAAGGYNQETGVTHFIPAEIAIPRALLYADRLIEELGPDRTGELTL